MTPTALWAVAEPARPLDGLHMDVNVTRDPGDEVALDAEKDRLVALGARVVRLVEQQWGPWPERYYQMQDPEGNEFCLQ